MIGDAIGNGVFMKHIAEKRFGHDFVVGIFFKHRRTCEAKKQCTRKCILNVYKHITKYASMTFVYNKYQSFTSDAIYFGL